MNPAPITTLYASLLALLTIFLAYRVSAVRRGKKIGLGDGDNKAVNCRIRAHGNLTEYMPLALILLLLFELRGPDAWQVHAFGAVFTLSRMAHAFGLSKSGGTTPGRLAGTLGTWLVIIVLAIMGVVASF